jgi:hypothetical protein
MANKTMKNRKAAFGGSRIEVLALLLGMLVNEVVWGSSSPSSSDSYYQPELGRRCLPGQRRQKDLPPQDLEFSFDTFHRNFQLPTFGNLDGFQRFVPWCCLGALDLFHNLESFENFAEDDMASIEP